MSRRGVLVLSALTLLLVIASAASPFEGLLQQGREYGEAGMQNAKETVQSVTGKPVAVHVENAKDSAAVAGEKASAAAGVARVTVSEAVDAASDPENLRAGLKKGREYGEAGMQYADETVQSVTGKPVAVHKENAQDAATVAGEKASEVASIAREKVSEAVDAVSNPNTLNSGLKQGHEAADVTYKKVVQALDAVVGEGEL
jgi:hypothetical protein